MCVGGVGEGVGGRGKGEWQQERRQDRIESWREDRERQDRGRKLGREWEKKIMQNACLVFAEMY